MCLIKLILFSNFQAPQGDSRTQSIVVVLLVSAASSHAMKRKCKIPHTQCGNQGNKYGDVLTDVMRRQHV